MLFSEKYGYREIQKIKPECVSSTLRARIWNLFYQYDIIGGGLASERLSASLYGKPTIENKIADRLGFILHSSLKGDSVSDLIREYLLTEAPYPEHICSEWYEVYDFIEIHLSMLEGDKQYERIKQYNTLLEEERAAYRIIGHCVVPITDKVEIAEIEQALSSNYDPVSIHIQKALELYSDIKTPDYENSIKESICAVESVCCIITDESGTQATLGKTLKKLADNGVHIHKAMESAFSSLYGYTSDEHGIRHGSIDFTNAPSEDAKFMLVACAAFVNYLLEKWIRISNQNSDGTNKEISNTEKE